MLILWSVILTLVLSIHSTASSIGKDARSPAAQIRTLRVPYKHVADLAIPTDIYIPTVSTPGKQTGLAPVLIMVHGGGFMLGSAKLNNKDQIQDSVERGWIVLAVEHRLCPGLNLLEGPITDVRDALAWAQSGGLATALKSVNETIRPDPDRIVAMGTSAGGHLVLSLVSSTSLLQFSHIALNAR